MRRILMMCGAIVISILFTQIAVAQDNNQSISDDLRKVWGDQGSGTGLSMDGMYDTQAGTDNTDEIGFADDVASTPIDGGISLLLAAGLVAGISRIKRGANKQQFNQSKKSVGDPPSNFLKAT